MAQREGTPMSTAATPRPPSPLAHGLVVLFTALAYVIAGWFALKLSLAAGWASPNCSSARRA